MSHQAFAPAQESSLEAKAEASFLEVISFHQVDHLSLH